MILVRILDFRIPSCLLTRLGSFLSTFKFDFSASSFAFFLKTFFLNCKYYRFVPIWGMWNSRSAVGLHFYWNAVGHKFRIYLSDCYHPLFYFIKYPDFQQYIANHTCNMSHKKRSKKWSSHDFRVCPVWYSRFLFLKMHLG